MSSQVEKEITPSGSQSSSGRLLKQFCEIEKIASSEQFKIAMIYGNHGLPCIGDLDVRQRGDPLKLADAIEAEVPTYNEFSGKAVASALRAMHEKGLIMDAMFGRESSPVLYIRPPFWTGQASNNKNDRSEDRKFTDTERKIMFQEILSILAGSTKPDELGWMPTSGRDGYETKTPTSEAYTVRAWWD